MKIYTYDAYDNQLELDAGRANTLATVISGILRESSLGNISINYRGANTQMLRQSLFRDDNSPDSSLFCRLFYFGDKAKSFLNESPVAKPIDTEIELHKVAISCFQKLHKMGQKLTNTKVHAFVDKHRPFFAYFENRQNESVFCSTICSIGPISLDYYYHILHTAGKSHANKSSRHVSSSESLTVALRFAVSGTRLVDGSSFVIVCINRVMKYINEGRMMSEEKKLPVLPEGSAIFPEQHEYSYRAAIFPHNILGCLVLSAAGDVEFVVNPHLFSEPNREVDFSRQPLHIDQDDFENQLKKTAYHTWVETIDSRAFKYCRLNKQVETET